MKRNLLLVLAMCIMLSVPAQWKGFAAFESYSVKRNINLLHIKDITADGIPDILSLYTAGDTELGLMKGIGHGKFSVEQNFPKADNYFPSDLADLNRDGFIDLVISSYWANGFTIHWGNGSGAFSPGEFIPTGVHGKEIICTDINKDGIADIVAATSGSGRPIYLHVFIGRGDGSFHPKKSYPSLLDTSKEIFITDKNNDGLPDIIISSSFPWLLIWYQQPDGNFEAKYIPLGTTARAGIADFNKDGREDLLLYYSSFDNDPNSDSIVIKLNNGDSTYSNSIPVTMPADIKIRPFELRIADINKDGYADLFIGHINEAGYRTDTIYCIMGDINMRFNTPQPVVLPAAVSTFTLADIDDDGVEDLIAACNNQHLYVSFNKLFDSQNTVSGIQLYPNPANNVLHIRDLKSRNKSMIVYNAAGQKIYQLNSKDQVSTLFTNRLPAGMYYLAIQMPSERVTLPFQKR
jgi:hypothetical protein